MSQPAYSLEAIKDLLMAQRHAVVAHYAPPRGGAYHDKGLYFTLNPGRADRSVGSFVVTLEGAKAGRWNDYATGEHGDLIDLIALSLGCDLKGAVREARGFLGLEADSPELRRQREAAAVRARELAAQAREKDAEERTRKRRYAKAVFLSAQERIGGTPVEWYLRDARGIDLRQLGRQPRSLRYLERCRYSHVDRSTGEVIEGEWPAMVAVAVDGHGEICALHRTWLALDAQGRWGKAPLPEPKKVVGDYAGACIHLWSGTGPRGGKGRPLSDCAPGTHVYIAEGIEDALSCALALPDARVLAAIAIGNMGRVSLPRNVAEVTIIGDRDDGAQAQQQLQRAVEAHAKAGRRVRLWLNGEGGKDLNDALRARLAAQRSAGGGGGAEVAPVHAPEEVPRSSGPSIPAGGEDKQNERGAA